MPVPILMPALSPTMEEGTLAKWLVAEGDRVTAGDVVAEIETDKATMEVEAVDEGVVGRIAVAEGTAGVRVNAPIAFLLGEGETADSLDAAEPAEESREPAEAAPVAPVTPAPPVTRAPSSAPVVASPAGSSAVRPEPRAFASPLARRLAAEAGLDFAEITGSGPRGRVVKRDIEAALAARTAPAAEARPAPVYAPAPGADAVKAMYPEDSYEEIPLDSMRRVVAERLTQAKRTVPHFYLSVDVEVDALLGARARANASLAARGMKLSVNDYCIKGAALALRDVPDCNVAFADDRILRFRVVDVAVAVAVEGGLFTPVLRGVDGRQLASISTEMKDLAARARARRLAPSEYQGGSITISNLGMYGIRNFDAVINPPHGSILALGAAEERAVVRDGSIRAATLMTATLSVDHRAIDGALGAQFLTAFRSYLEDPALMAV